MTVTVAKFEKKVLRGLRPPPACPPAQHTSARGMTFGMHRPSNPQAQHNPKPKKPANKKAKKKQVCNHPGASSCPTRWFRRHRTPWPHKPFLPIFGQVEHQEKHLGWDGFDDYKKAEEVTVILKHMFTLQEMQVAFVCGRTPRSTRQCVVVTWRRRAGGPVIPGGAGGGRRV